MYINHSFNVGDIVKLKGFSREMMITTLGGKEALLDESKKYNGKVTCKWYKDGMETYRDFNVDELEFVRTSHGVNVEKKRGLFILILCLLFVTNNSMAEDFYSDVIYYNILSDSAVEVTYSSISSSSYKYKGNIVIPEKVNYNGVLYTVTRIGEGAFYGCQDLTSITIPNSVTSIGDRAFYYCYGLTSITIPNSVISIGEFAFRKCTGLTSITIPNSVITIGKHAISGCPGLTSITIPNSVRSIGDGVFSDCSGLTSITIPNSVISIGVQAFYGCSGLTSITIPNSVRSIGEKAFQECTGLTNITIGSSVTSIGDYAFTGCSGLTSITIPNSVTSIGLAAFPALTSITIGSSVTSIGPYALPSSLTSITIAATTPPTVMKQRFDATDLLTVKVRVPKGSLTAYQAAEFWGLFWNIEEYDPTGIEDVQTDMHNSTAPIYNLQGVQVKETIEALPAGIYIQDGKKFIVK